MHGRQQKTSSHLIEADHKSFLSCSTKTIKKAVLVSYRHLSYPAKTAPTAKGRPTFHYKKKSMKKISPERGHHRNTYSHLSLRFHTRSPSLINQKDYLVAANPKEEEQHAAYMHRASLPKFLHSTRRKSKIDRCSRYDSRLLSTWRTLNPTRACNKDHKEPWQTCKNYSS